MFAVWAMKTVYAEYVVENEDVKVSVDTERSIKDGVVGLLGSWGRVEQSTVLLSCVSGKITSSAGPVLRVLCFQRLSSFREGQKDKNNEYMRKYVYVLEFQIYHWVGGNYWNMNQTV